MEMTPFGDAARIDQQIGPSVPLVRRSCHYATAPTQRYFHLKRPSDGELANPRSSLSWYRTQDMDASLDSLYPCVRHDTTDLKRRSSLPDHLAKLPPLAGFDFGLQDNAHHKTRSATALRSSKDNNAHVDFVPSTGPTSAISPQPSRRPSYSLFPVSSFPTEEQASLPSSPTVESASSSRHPSVSTASERSRADSVASFKCPAIKSPTKDARRRGYVLPRRPSTAALVASVTLPSSTGLCSPLSTELAGDTKNISRWSSDTSPTACTAAYALDDPARARPVSSLVSSPSSHPTSQASAPPHVGAQPDRRRPTPLLTCLYKPSSVILAAPPVPTTHPMTFLSTPTAGGATSFFDADDSDQETGPGRDEDDNTSLLRKWTTARKRRPSAPRVVTVNAKVGPDESKPLPIPTSPTSPELKSTISMPGAIDWAPVGARTMHEASVDGDVTLAAVRDDDHGVDETDQKSAWRRFFCGC